MTKFCNSFKYVTFDLFDTLIIRRYLKPATIFSELEIEASNNGISSKGFSKLRIDAEFKAREINSFNREVTLDEIYSHSVLKSNYSTQELNWFYESELEIEDRSIFPNAMAIKQLDSLRKKGVVVVFITDIYLPEKFIKDTLKKLGFYKEQDKLYVSSSIGVMKANGELFKYVLSDLNAKPSDFAHYGDNFISDVEQPSNLNLTSFHYKDTFPNRYESHHDAISITEKVIGVSRCNRLSFFYEDQRSQTIHEVTSNVSAPLMFNFTLWTIQKAIDKGIKTIFYFARDGQILFEMAKKIINKFYKDKITAKYLYVSRQSLLFPAINDSIQEGFEWIFAPTSLLNVDIILKRINFKSDEFKSVLNSNGITDFSSHLSDHQRVTIKNILIENNDLIVSRAKEFRTKLYSYLKQEQFFLEENVSIVDIGWGGTLQYSISKIAAESGNNLNIHGYYFGIRRRKLYKPTDTMSAWFTDHEGKINDLDKQAYIVPMTELFTMADHGGTNYYDNVNGHITPILREKHNTVGMRWGVKVQHESMKSFTDILLDVVRLNDLHDMPSILLPQLEENYRRFFLEPSMKEAIAYCAYNDSEDQSESYYKLMGRPYSFKELNEFFSNDFMHHHNEWRQGSLKLTNQLLVNFAFKKSQQVISK